GLDWVELRASQGDDEFTQVSLAFAAGTLRLMRMVDNLGNITDIEFSELEINIPVDSNLFSFTPPAGVDVLGE
ncbi:MAG TPA: outer-membrane lipoprotein carrier protein LolA, partial [Gammaproteobacteria bacterium]